MTSTVINCIAYDAGGGRHSEPSLNDVSTLLKRPELFLWIGVHEPDAALLTRLQRLFNLHELAIEDAGNAHQRPKIEVYDQTLFLALHTAHMENGTIRFAETHIFLGSNYMVTIRHGDSISYQDARQRCERNPTLIKLGPSGALYSVLDQIVDQFRPIISGYQDELRKLEGLIFDGDFKRSTLQRLYELKRELIKLRLAVDPLEDVLGQLVHLHQGLIHDEVRVYFRDVLDHAVRAAQLCEALSEMLSAALQINLALVTVRQNDVVKRLAGWAAILALPTMIASFYGMNFERMPELNWTYGYPLVIGLMASISGLLFWRLRRMGWL